MREVTARILLFGGDRRCGLTGRTRPGAPRPESGAACARGPPKPLAEPSCGVTAQPGPIGPAALAGGSRDIARWAWPKGQNLELRFKEARNTKRWTERILELKDCRASLDLPSEGTVFGF